MDPHLPKDSPNGNYGINMAQLAVTLHEKTDGLAAFLERASAYPNRSIGAIARELARIRLRATAGDIAALVAEVRHHDTGYVPSIRSRDDRARDWLALASVRALADMNGKESPALLRRYGELLARVPEDTNNAGYGDRIWVLSALCCSKAPEARAYLLDLQTRAAKGEAVGVGPDDLRIAI